MVTATVLVLVWGRCTLREFASVFAFAFASLVGRGVSVSWC